MGSSFCAAELHGAYDSDLMATLTEFVSRTVVLGLSHCMHLDPPVSEVIVAGGGTNNPVLMERLTEMLMPIPLRRSDDFGVPRMPVRPWRSPSWAT